MIAAAAVSLGLASAMGPAAEGRAQAGPPAEALPEGQEALARARAEAARARERAATLDRQAQAATRAGERATIEAAALAARVQQAEAALSAAAAGLAVVRRERRALDLRLARERAPVTRLVAGLQSLVRRPALLTLVQPGSVADAVHLRTVVAAVQPQISARTAGLRNALGRARALEREAAQIATQRRALQSDLSARRRELAAVSAAERLKAWRAAGAADREAERAYAIGEEARDLSVLVRRLAARPRDGRFARSSELPPSGNPAGATLAHFRLPVFGSLVPAASTRERGLTLLAQPGAVVVAPAAGRVAFAGPYRGYGAIVIVEHEGGWTSLITGLAASDVAVGQALIAGSPIGRASSRNPEIGLELRRNGQRANPLDQLR